MRWNEKTRGTIFLNVNKKSNKIPKSGVIQKIIYGRNFLSQSERKQNKLPFWEDEQK